MNQEEPTNEESGEKVVNPEKETFRELFRDTGESQSAYLWRSGEIISRTVPMLTKIEAITDETVTENVRKNIEQVVAQSALPESGTREKKERSEEEWQAFQGMISRHSLGEFSDSDGFDETVRDRGFFRFNSSENSSKRETYWNTLFFSLNTKETRELAKKMLDQKKVVLLGGGRSELKHELEAHDIHPESIVNIDPFVENPAPGADKVIPVSASDEKMTEKIPENLAGQVDEVWAEYSVPAYLQTEEEIKQLMSNIDTLLASGGVARIWPIEVGGMNDGELALAKQTLYESVRGLVEKSGYELVTYKACGRPGMTLMKPKESLAAIENDEEKIAQIMDQLKSL